MDRRGLIVGAGAAALAAGSVRAAERPRWMSPLLPDGARDVAVLEALPGKQKLIRLSDRPPNYETPIDVFRTAITPNEDFFVRYHLADVPPMADLGNWSLKGRRRGSGTPDHPQPRRTAEELRAGGGGRGLSVFRQSPRPVVAACGRC
jgi:hypothetical protein